MRDERVSFEERPNVLKQNKTYRTGEQTSPPLIVTRNVLTVSGGPHWTKIELIK